MSEEWRLAVDLLILAAQLFGSAFGVIVVVYLLAALWRKSAPRVNAFWCGRHGYVPLPSLDRLPRGKQ